MSRCWIVEYHSIVPRRTSERQEFLKWKRNRNYPRRGERADGGRPKCVRKYDGWTAERFVIWPLLDFAHIWDFKIQENFLLSGERAARQMRICAWNGVRWKQQSNSNNESICSAHYTQSNIRIYTLHILRMTSAVARHYSSSHNRSHFASVSSACVLLLSAACGCCASRSHTPHSHYGRFHISFFLFFCCCSSPQSVYLSSMRTTACVRSFFVFMHDHDAWCVSLCVCEVSCACLLHTYIHIRMYMYVFTVMLMVLRFSCFAFLWWKMTSCCFKPNGNQ